MTSRLFVASLFPPCSARATCRPRRPELCHLVVETHCQLVLLELAPRDPEHRVAPRQLSYFGLVERNKGPRPSLLLLAELAE
jgi:hypothetical protein